MKKFSIISNVIALAVAGICLATVILLYNMQYSISEAEIANNIKSVKNIEKQMVSIQDFIDDTEDKFIAIEENMTVLQSGIEDVQKEQAVFRKMANDEIIEEEPEEQEQKEEESKDDEQEENQENGKAKIKSTGGFVVDTKGEYATVTTRYLNLREKHEIDGTVLKQLKKGYKVKNLKIIEKTDGYWWRQVEYDGVKGWVASRFLK